MIRTCSKCGQKNRISAEHLADAWRCGACKAPFTAIAEPLDANDASFDEIVSKARVPVLVDFWAPWCGPCRMAAPEVSRTAAIMSGRAIILKVNTEESPALAERFNIMSIPNFMVLKNGAVVRQQPGLVDHRQLIAWLTMAGA